MSYVNAFNNYSLQGLNSQVQEDGEMGHHLNHAGEMHEWNYDRKFNNGENTGLSPNDDWPSDEKIKERVCRALFRDRLIDAQQVQVEVKEGVVTVEGKVTSSMIKRFASEIIDGIFGVKEVLNRLTLLPDHGLVGSLEWPI